MQWIWPLLLVFTLTSCGGGSRALAPVGSYGYESNQRKIAKTPYSYTVKKGDTLYSISWRYGMDYKELARINGIRSPYTIYVGQKLKFRGSTSSTRTPSSASSSKQKVVTKPTTPSPKPKTQAKPTSQPSTASTNSSYTGSQNLQWRWPTDGLVIATYSNSSSGGKGIDISGKAGQPVVAAASGKVVYSGNGLPRYGNLLIIKHNDVYLSAYAHNERLLVKEGEVVKSGQKIATLGRTGTQRYQLHFEIRRNGKPVDPQRFLPKQ